MEDIRAARRWRVTTTKVSIASGATGPLVPADSTRVRLGLAYDPPATTGINACVQIGPLVGTAVAPFATLSSGLPTIMLRVEEWGSCVTGPVQASNNSGANVNVFVTTVQSVDEDL